MMEKDLNDMISEIDGELYRIAYVNKDYKKLRELWLNIRKDEQLLWLASQVIKDKFDEKDIFASNCLVALTLDDYNHVNRGIYGDVVNKIYDSEDLARIVLDESTNGGYSFLLYTLDNNKLKLSDKQKAFAYNEAMNQPGTRRTEDYKSVYDLRLNTCHGRYPYDIRYHILKNHNWSLEEKQIMVQDFYVDEQAYANLVNQVEIDIQELYAEAMQVVPIDEIIYLSEEDIKNLVVNRNKRFEIMNETAFVKTLRKIRKPDFTLL